MLARLNFIVRQLEKADDVMYLQELVTNVYLLFVALIFLIAAFHLWLIKHKKLTKKGWLKIEYFALFFAAVGIVSVSADVRKWVFSNITEFEERGVHAAYNRIVSNVESAIAYMQCNETSAQVYLPEHEPKRKKVCAWLLVVGNEVPIYDKEQAPILGGEVFLNPPRTGKESIDEPARRVVSAVQQYEDWRRQYLAKIQKTQETTLEKLLRFFAPLSLVIGIALKVTKTTAEYKGFA